LLGQGEVRFAKHFTEMLKTHDRKDRPRRSSGGNHDVAVYTGNQADYTLSPDVMAAWSPARTPTEPGCRCQIIDNVGEAPRGWHRAALRRHRSLIGVEYLTSPQSQFQHRAFR
jgi:hypothetical protein